MFKLFKKKELYYKYSGVYTYANMKKFYTFYDVWARNREEVDRYVLSIMEDMELDHPYFCLSCHATEAKRI